MLMVRLGVVYLGRPMMLKLDRHNPSVQQDGVPNSA